MKWKNLTVEFDKKQCKKMLTLKRFFLFFKDVFWSRSPFVFSFSVIPDRQEKSFLVRTPMRGVGGRKETRLKRQRRVFSESV